MEQHPDYSLISNPLEAELALADILTSIPPFPADEFARAVEQNELMVDAGLDVLERRCLHQDFADELLAVLAYDGTATARKLMARINAGRIRPGGMTGETFQQLNWTLVPPSTTAHGSV